MHISNTTVALLLSVLMFSVFVANLANLINVEMNYAPPANNQEAATSTTYNTSVKMTDSSEKLMWFLQISDIHISIFHDPSRTTELKDFCGKTVPTFNPTAIVASGDLTDAKEYNKMGSRQFEGEWMAYRNAIDECRQRNDVWLDIRGNHDNFNVAGPNSPFNYYQNYSMQGKNNPRSYKHDVTVDGEKYTFIGIDACIEPGPRRPFNFVGILKHEDVNQIIHLAEDSLAQGSKYLIWFGHYPTSSILAQTPGGIRAILGKYLEGYAYLCGHFHMLGGLVPNMYTLQQTGFLELELGDWKDNRMYRLVAMDHGLLSFIDVEHKNWPVVLITNPKHALYRIPSRENLRTMTQSTHIRLLAFSPGQITQLKLRINKDNWQDCINSDGPLYVVPWDPSQYSTGLHNIEVYVKDEFGREKLITQPFSLDGTRLSFGILPRLALMTNVSRLFQCMFGIMLLICTLPLCVLKYLHGQVQAGKWGRPKVRCGSAFLRKLWVLASVDRLYYPLVFYALYISVGPWSVGYIIEEYVGIIFAWGIFVNGAYLPGSFTYAYGFLQLCTFHVPLTLLLANASDVRLLYHVGKARTPRTRLRKMMTQSPFLLIIMAQVLFAYFFWLAYGTLAFIVGPLRTWSIVFAVWLWYQAFHLPEKCTRDAAKVWYFRDATVSDHGDTDGHHRTM